MALLPAQDVSVSVPSRAHVPASIEAYNDEPEVRNGEHGCTFGEELRNCDREVLEEVGVPVPHGLGRVRAGEERGADVASGVNAIAGPRGYQAHTGLDTDGNSNVLGACKRGLGRKSARAMTQKTTLTNHTIDIDDDGLSGEDRRKSGRGGDYHVLSCCASCECSKYEGVLEHG